MKNKELELDGVVTGMTLRLLTTVPIQMKERQVRKAVMLRHTSTLREEGWKNGRIIHKEVMMPAQGSSKTQQILCYSKNTMRKCVQIWKGIGTLTKEREKSHSI